MKKNKETAVEVETKKMETSEDVSLSVEEKRNATIVEADAAEKALDEKKTKKKKSLFREILRFCVTGVVCTLVDFGCQFGMLKVFENNLSQIGNWGFYVAFAIAITVGFIISTCVNFILSRLWVFQNVDKKVNTKSAKAFWTYFFLGFVGLCIGVGVQEGGVFLCNSVWSVGITYDITRVSWSELFNEGGIAFWCFVAVFCIKTIVTMIYNYLTRKFVIFKAPKKEEVHEIVVQEEKPVLPAPVEKKEEPKLVTASSFKKIFHEELDKTLGPGYHKMNKEKAWRMVNEEINKREESGSTK